ncbi:ABC transporter substrate-binding protein [Loigolactobacillus jiayinensis]|uniref:ABC transporter substrate-binding protein n=1 Tax=Loigolactobacillus jiayinensis TaxID=2486016 RepID=A0ABW1RDU4_9LACO|nr:ABC transporter substrate-binding protein [Loigolactobacillus jiayinensis]
MKKKLWGLIALLSLFMMLFASFGNSSSTQAASKTETIKIGYMGSVNSVGLAAIAKQAGYYEKQGLKVKLVEFADGPSVIAAMKSGSIDIGEIGPGAHTQVAQGNAKIVMFDGLSTSDKIIANKKSGISSIKDLKGKKVAVVVGTTSQVILDAALKKAGMTESDVKVVSMSVNSIVNAMVSGKIDAAATWAPGTTKIKEKLGKNAVTLATDNDFTDSMPFTCSWIVTPSYAKKHKATILKFDKAMLQAMNYRESGGKNAAKWIAKQLGFSESDVKKQITSTEKIYTSKQLVKLINNGNLLQYYTKQQKNFIKLGILKDTGKLETAKDYVMTDMIKKAAAAIE